MGKYAKWGALREPAESGRPGVVDGGTAAEVAIDPAGKDSEVPHLGPLVLAKARSPHSHRLPPPNTSSQTTATMRGNHLHEQESVGTTTNKTDVNPQ